MDTNKKNRERISALCDDALPKDDHELASAALRTADGTAAWEAYHLIGDVLRMGAAPALSSGFAARLGARLAAEPLHARRAPTTTALSEAGAAVTAAAAAAAAANAATAVTAATATAATTTNTAAQHEHAAPGEMTASTPGS